MRSQMILTILVEPWALLGIKAMLVVYSLTSMMDE